MKQAASKQAINQISKQAISQQSNKFKHIIKVYIKNTMPAKGIDSFVVRTM